MGLQWFGGVWASKSEVERGQETSLGGYRRAKKKAILTGKTDQTFHQ